MATPYPHHHSPAWYTARHPGAVAGGVCATAADLTGVPAIWLRIALVVGLMEWCWPIGIAYVVASIALRTQLRRLLPAPTTSAAPMSPPGSPLATFADLERRLARVEATVTSGELKLRWSFREMEQQ